MSSINQKKRKDVDGQHTEVNKYNMNLKKINSKLCYVGEVDGLASDVELRENSSLSLTSNVASANKRKQTRPS